MISGTGKLSMLKTIPVIMVLSTGLFSAAAGQGLLTTVTIQQFEPFHQPGSSDQVPLCSKSDAIKAGHLPGQIIQDPDNPSFMLRNEDKDRDGLLDPYWLVGHGGPESFLHLAQVLPGWNQDSILDFIGQHGGNAIYIMAWGQDWVGSPRPELYPEWHRWIKKMDEYGIVAFFIFYDDKVPHQGDDELRAIVDEFETHPNIIWCICEEEHFAIKDKATEIADLVRSADDYGHVIAIHDTWYPGNDMLAYQVTNHSVSEAHETALKYFEETRMSNSAEDHYTDVSRNDPDRTRKVIWANAMAGNYFMQLGSWEDQLGRKPPEISECNYMRYAADFLMGIPDINEMRPIDNIVKSGNAWAFGKQNHYILYFVQGGSATLDLSGSSGNLSVVWYNPRTAKIISGSLITAGSSVSLSAPDKKDWVVEIGGI